MPLLSASEVQHLIVNGLGIGKSGGFRVSHIGDGTATMIFDYHPTMLRPGGTISGPTLMLAADAVMYAAVLGHYGAKEMAVTSTLNIQFLNKPQPAALRAEAKILKAGRRLAVLAVEIYTDEQLVAHATGSYALPAQSDLKK